ncbi:MAG: HAMP domain-containing sensor histidine kinase [Actinomycetota bacterium]|nr:HAMP domain-containing sensor histidine kinase [Actinomycetota bacterium]
MSIRLRLALIVALTASVLVAAGGVVFAVLLSSGLRATVEDSLRRSAARLVAEVDSGRVVLGARTPVVEPAHDQSIVQVLSVHGRVEFTTVRAGRVPLLSAAQRTSAQAGHTFVETAFPGWRNPRLLFAEPIKGHPGQLAVSGASLDELDNAMGRLRLLLVGGGIVVVVAASLGASVLAGRALSPVERLRAETAAISSRAPDRRLAVPKTHDEIARLAETLNSLLDRLQGALGRQREFVAVASHELRTPLAVLQAELEIARRPGRSEEEIRRALDVLSPRVELLTRLAADLLLLARGDEGTLPLERAPQALEPLVAETLGAMSGVAEAQGCVLALDADPEVAAAVDPGRFQQVLHNLVANAVEHAAGGHLVDVRVRAEGEDAVVEVRDGGSGFPPEVLARAFERFTRADAPMRAGRRGAGLGLAVVRLIVESHGGRVEARNLAAGGASVLVRLPACPVGIPHDAVT